MGVKVIGPVELYKNCSCDTSSEIMYNLMQNIVGMLFVLALPVKNTRWGCRIIGFASLTLAPRSCEHNLLIDEEPRRSSFEYLEDLLLLLLPCQARVVVVIVFLCIPLCSDAL